MYEKAQTAMNQFSFRINSTDVDFQEKVHIHALFGILQESAARDAADSGWGSIEMERMNASWILVRMSVRMIRKPLIDETISIQTWSRGHKRIFCYRDFLIIDAKDHIIGKATSIWVIIEKTSGKTILPDRLKSSSERVFEEKMVFSDNAIRLRPFVTDIDQAKEQGNHIIKHADFTDIDKNFHVNNARYIAWSVDAAHFFDLTKYDILSADINYLYAVKHKEKIILFFRKERDEIHVNGIVEESGTLAFCTHLSTKESLGGLK